MEPESLARMYAANLLAKDNPKAAATELFDMMERSIASDTKKKQEAAKDFLILIIKIINDIDQNYADEVTNCYFDQTLQHYLNF